MKKALSIIIALLFIATGVVIYYKDNQQTENLIPNILKEDAVGDAASREVFNFMKLTSSAFKNNEMIPVKYTCDGDNINPPLEISEVSERARSLVLIVDDPDAPSGDWVHWVVWNIPVGTAEIPEGGPLPKEASEGITDFGKPGYGGPCPPSGTHRYLFKLYAIGTDLYLDSSATKKETEEAMGDMVIEKAELVGLYQRQ